MQKYQKVEYLKFCPLIYRKFTQRLFFGSKGDPANCAKNPIIFV